MNILYVHWNCSLYLLISSFPNDIIILAGLPPIFVPTCELVKTVRWHPHSFLGLAIIVTQGTETLKGAHSAFMVNRRFATLER